MSRKKSIPFILVLYIVYSTFFVINDYYPLYGLFKPRNHKRYRNKSYFNNYVSLTVGTQSNIFFRLDSQFTNIYGKQIGEKNRTCPEAESEQKSIF